MKPSPLSVLSLLAACCLQVASAEASLYVASQSDAGVIYHFASDGSLLDTTRAGQIVGVVNSVAVQAETGRVVAAAEGNLYLINADLTSPTQIGNNFGAFTSIASQSDGNFIAATTSGDMISNWKADGAYVGGIGYGWKDAHVAVGLNNTVFVTADFDGVYNLCVFSDTYDYLGGTSTDVGNNITVNLLSGHIWTAGNKQGNILRFDAAGKIIDEIGNGWGQGVLASSSDGKIWFASNALGGSLSAWDASGEYLGTHQKGIGAIAAIAVDPTDGTVFVGLTDASGGVINRYSPEGKLLGSFGSGLGITSMVAAPEPTSVSKLLEKPLDGEDAKDRYSSDAISTHSIAKVIISYPISSRSANN